MGALLGSLLGLGLLLVLASLRPRAPKPPSRGWQDSTQDLLDKAGVKGVSPAQLVAVCAGTGLLCAVVVFAVSATWPLAVAFAVIGGLLPRSVVSRRALRRSTLLRDLWPEVVDNLSSAVRAGLALPEAVAALGQRGPEELRPPFLAFAEDYRATGSFARCLDRLGDSLADPVGDRIVESLRLAREVGGTDLGTLLRTLSQFLREDARARAELETRQQATVNAARLALAAPWMVLLLLSTQSSTITAYNSMTGAMLLAIGGGVACLAYVLMKRIGRLPQERRVLR